MFEAMLAELCPDLGELPLQCSAFFLCGRCVCISWLFSVKAPGCPDGYLKVKDLPD